MNSDALTNQLLVIKAELAIDRNCLHDAAVAAAHGDFEQARQLIANSKRFHKTVLEQLSKLRSSYDVRSLTAAARIVEGEIVELSRQIDKNDPQRNR